MDEFLEDLKSGDIRFRDKWQFELKSEFYPKGMQKESVYTQEFYFFIPNALQIKQGTYSKEAFYRDLTNFIRYKTPEMRFRDILAMDQEDSPLFRLRGLALKPEAPENLLKLETELKLFGTIFRSALREETAALLHASEKEDKVQKFCAEIQQIRTEFLSLKETLIFTYSSTHLVITFAYLDEFSSNSIDYFLTGLLDELRKSTVSPSVDESLCQVILEESKHRYAMHHPTIRLHERGEHDEQVLYRSGLLKKFVMDALLLPVNRASVQEKYGNLIASFSAGIAMLVYLLLFIWQANWIAINSALFVVITVIAYILKDRLKDALKSISYQRAFRWFSDYTTEIRTPDDMHNIGQLKESFAFVDEKDIAEEIRAIRHHEFHSMLESFKRPEQVIYFKRTVKIFLESSTRLNALNIILRFNIHEFLSKASSPYHTYITLNPQNRKLLHMRMPKVYHINVILKNSYTGVDNQPVIELKKYRLIVDKNGIKTIEEPTTT